MPLECLGEINYIPESEAQKTLNFNFRGWEICAVSRILLDNLGELVCMQWFPKKARDRWSSAGYLIVRCQLL